MFPSSRQVKRAVGVTAWAILEDIALDATLDVEGRLVAETNVRQIATNLGLSKNTVTRHLALLREHGFVLHEEERDTGTGRYEVSRYVLDPSACVERFTLTPAPSARGRADPIATDAPATPGPTSTTRTPAQAETDPRPKIWDTAPCPKNGGVVTAASQDTGHRDLGQNNKRAVVVEEEQQQPGQHETELVRCLSALGVASDRAATLVATHPSERIRNALDAVEAVAVRNPAGWVISAIRDGWDVTDAAAQQQQQRAAHDRRRVAHNRQVADQQHEVEQRRRAGGWAAVVSAALDDDQLAAAVSQLVPEVPGINRRSVPIARSHLVAWAARVHRASPTTPVPTTLTEALNAPETADPVEPADTYHLDEPPPAPPGATPLDDRLAACLRSLDADPTVPPSHSATT